MATDLKFKGVIPANLFPFKHDYSIHEKDYRKHLDWLADVRPPLQPIDDGERQRISQALKQAGLKPA